jgi:HSP20 family protein
MSSDPFDDIERMFDRLSTQFEDLEPVDLGLGSGLSVDLTDEGESFSLVADLAGYDSDDIEVSLVDERTVRISADRQIGSEEDEEGVYVRQERRESISRTVSLPGPVDSEATSASYDAGVLTVTLPKHDPDDEEGHTIPVN